MMKSWTSVFSFLFLLIGAANAFAQSHKGISFQGVIKLPSGELPTRSGMTVNARILSPNNCVLREEQFTGVEISSGYIYLVIGAGSVTGLDPGFSLQKVMDNSAVLNSVTCLNADGTVNVATNSFNPLGTSGARKFRISLVIDSTAIVADFNMRAMPFALNSETLNGKSEVDFINTSSVITQNNVENWFASSVLGQLLAGTYNAPSATTAVTATNVSGVVGVANGGTGATTAAGARTALGLSAIAVSGSATDLTTGTVAPARLGSGTADSTKFLRGDGTWAVASAGGITALTGDISASGVGSVVATIAGDAVTSSKIQDGTISKVDLDFGGANSSSSSFVVVDGSGKFTNFSCATVGYLPTWTASGWACQGPSNSLSSEFTLSAANEIRFADADSSNYIGFKSPSVVSANKIWTLPAADGTAGQILKTDGAGNLSWVNDATGAAPAEASYTAKGVVQFQTDADTSGVSISSGVASVNTGTGANQIVKLDGTAKIPAVDGSLLTNVTTTIDRITSAATKYFTYAPNNVACANGQVLTKTANGWECGNSNPGTVTSITVDTGLTGGTITGVGTIGLGAELSAVNGLASTGFVQRTGAGSYSTTNANTLASANSLVQRDGSGISSFYGIGVSGATTGSVTLQAPAAVTSYSLTFPNAQGGAGQVLSNNGSGVLSWMSPMDKSLNSANIWVGNSSNIATAVSLSGDATISNAGVLTLNTVSIDKGGTGATTVAAARTNLGLGTSAIVNTGTSSGLIPVIGASGITANMMCTSDGTSAIVCNTAVPTGDFKSNGTVAMTDQLKAVSGTAAAPGFTFSADLDSGLLNPLANTVSISTGGSERVRVDSAGNVGIGTVAPATALDVNGSANFKSTYEVISSAYVNSGASYAIADTSMNIRRITLTNNTTITLPSFTSPTSAVYTLTVFIKQDDTGARTVTWAGSGSDTVKWDGGAAPTIVSTAGKISIIQFTKPSDESVWYGSMVWREN